MTSLMLVSLDEASEHIRRDTTDDDNDLLLKIKAASRAVVTYMQDGADIFLDSAGDPYLDSNGIVTDVPDDVKIATLILIGVLYKERDGEAGTINPDWQYGYMPNSVTALLYPYRTPSCA